MTVCGNCGHTRKSVAPGVFWCPRCGSCGEPGRGLDEVPKWTAPVAVPGRRPMPVVQWLALVAYYADGQTVITSPGPAEIRAAAVQYHAPSDIFLDAVIAVDEPDQPPGNPREAMETVFAEIDRLPAVE